ncbi:MAG: HD domain-containing protein [Candidatus Omnitrophica bacterium]|nr:HD domain-containing protein [Candidatus Omnitrophota bacterium]
MVIALCLPVRTLCADDFSRGAACLSPQISLNDPALIARYGIWCDTGRVPFPASSGARTNHEYRQFLQALAGRYGSADDLLIRIKREHGDRYSRAIEQLEALEAGRPELYHWVIAHEKEVMVIFYALGKILNLSEQQLVQGALGCRFHDIGKYIDSKNVAYNRGIFFNGIHYTPAEKELLREELVKHAQRSCDIMKACGVEDETVLAVALHHHANVDGTGYPQPLTREEIPLAAKIARVADSFSAMLGARPYNGRQSISFNAAVADIEENIDKAYGPGVVAAFERLVGALPFDQQSRLFYSVPVRARKIFHALLRQAQGIPYTYPFAKVACGVSAAGNDVPFCMAVNSIGTHRHAEINLVLNVLEQSLRMRDARRQNMSRLKRLDFLADTVKINENEEARRLLQEISQTAGDPFKNTVIYSTLRPCAACVQVLQALGVKEIYFASEHPDQEFVRKSESAAALLRQSGGRMALAHFIKEGVIEPNALFFAVCTNSDYEVCADVINKWYHAYITRNDEGLLSQHMQRMKRHLFQQKIDELLRKLKFSPARLKVVADLIAGTSVIETPCSAIISASAWCDRAI